MLGRTDDARTTLARICQDFGTDSPRCLMQTVALLAASGRAAEVGPALTKLGASPRIHTGGASAGYSSISAMYANDLRDYRKAAAAIRDMLDASDWSPTLPLLDAAGGAKLPEEMSTDPEWLAAWNDPRLKELMDAYRANLAAFRKGN